MTPLLLLCLRAAQAGDLVSMWALESDNGALQISGDEGQWEWGTLPTSYGPGEGLTGSFGWATRLSHPYLNDASASLHLPSFPLGGIAQPTLELVHWYSVDSKDSARVEVFQGGSWQTLEPVYGYPHPLGFTGQSQTWIRSWFDLTGVTDLSDLRLTLITDATVQLPGWYLDEFTLWDGDVAPPQILDVDVLEDTEDLDGPYRVSALVEDDVGLISVHIVYRVDGQDTSSAPMVMGADGRWSGEIPGPWPADTTITYQVQAEDGENTALSPSLAPTSFRVRLPAPRNLSGPTGRVVDTQAGLQWDPPDSSLHTVTAYRVWREDTLLVETPSTAAVVDLVGKDLDVFAVSAVYEAGEGDKSGSLALDVALPEVLSFTPTELWPGDRVRARLTGRYLLMATDALEVSLGEGVEVLAVDVITVDEAQIELSLAEDAQPGPRDLQLRSGAVELSAEEVMQVRGDGARPQLLSLDPEAVSQGATQSFTLTLDALLTEAPEVDLGEGVIVESVSLGEDGALTVLAVVEPTAPLGTREVTVDDGVRFYEGVTLRVRDQVAPPSRVCASAQGARAGWVLALVWLLRRRRL